MMMVTRKLAMVLTVGVACLALGGCYDPQAVNEFLKTSQSPVSSEEYVFLPPDALSITSRQVPEINGITQVIRPDGKINLPLIGEITVAGKTPRQVELAMMEAAKEYYEQTDAVVTVAAYNSKKFYVFGQVGTPGPQPYTGHDTLLNALAIVQPTYLAWQQRIIVVRGSRPQDGGYAPSVTPSEEDLTYFRRWGEWRETPEHPRETMIVNMWAMVKHGDLSHNVYLQPNDVIYVQAHPFAKVGLTLQALLFPVQPVLEAVRAPANISNAGK
ncbi:MAG: polysaccharide export protein [Phycisphaerae bacterium]|nr:polysaccharide export protein [Phycisphaerae bacterium]